MKVNTASTDVDIRLLYFNVIFEALSRIKNNGKCLELSRVGIGICTIDVVSNIIYRIMIAFRARMLLIVPICSAKRSCSRKY